MLPAKTPHTQTQDSALHKRKAVAAAAVLGGFVMTAGGRRKSAALAVVPSPKGAMLVIASDMDLLGRVLAQEKVHPEEIRHLDISLHPTMTEAVRKGMSAVELPIYAARAPGGSPLPDWKRAEVSPEHIMLSDEDDALLMAWRAVTPHVLDFDPSHADAGKFGAYTIQEGMEKSSFYFDAAGPDQDSFRITDLPSPDDAHELAEIHHAAARHNLPLPFGSSRDWIGMQNNAPRLSRDELWRLSRVQFPQEGPEPGPAQRYELTPTADGEHAPRYFDTPEEAGLVVLGHKLARRHYDMRQREAAAGDRDPSETVRRARWIAGLVADSMLADRKSDRALADATLYQKCRAVESSFPDGPAYPAYLKMASDVLKEVGRDDYRMIPFEPMRRLAQHGAETIDSTRKTMQEINLVGSRGHDRVR